MAKIGFLGLGVMGYPMAGHLQTHGHQVTVYNRTQAKADNWVRDHNGAQAATPAAAATGADFVMACVGNDDDLRIARPTRVEAEIAGSASHDQPHVSVVDAVGFDRLFNGHRHGLASHARVLLKVEPNGIRTLVKAVDVVFKQEDSAGVNPDSLEDAITVQQTVIVNADCRLFFGYKRAVDVNLRHENAPG